MGQVTSTPVWNGTEPGRSTCHQRSDGSFYEHLVCEGCLYQGFHINAPNPPVIDFTTLQCDIDLWLDEVAEDEGLPDGRVFDWLLANRNRFVGIGNERSTIRAFHQAPITKSLWQTSWAWQYYEYRQQVEEICDERREERRSSTLAATCIKALATELLRSETMDADLQMIHEKMPAWVLERVIRSGTLRYRLLQALSKLSLGGEYDAIVAWEFGELGSNFKQRTTDYPEWCLERPGSCEVRRPDHPLNLLRQRVDLNQSLRQRLSSLEPIELEGI